MPHRWMTHADWLSACLLHRTKQKINQKAEECKNSFKIIKKH